MLFNIDVSKKRNFKFQLVSCLFCTDQVLNDNLGSENHILCIKMYVCSSDDMKKNPVVVIRRPFQKSAVLECVVTGLPSDMICIKFHVNNSEISELICADCATSENIWSLTTPFTPSSDHQKPNSNFTCTVHGFSKSWESKPTGNIFGRE